MRQESEGFKCLPEYVPIPQPVALCESEERKEHDGEGWVAPLTES